MRIGVKEDTPMTLSWASFGPRLVHPLSSSSSSSSPAACPLSKYLTSQHVLKAHQFSEPLLPPPWKPLLHHGLFLQIFCDGCILHGRLLIDGRLIWAWISSHVEVAGHGVYSCGSGVFFVCHARLITTITEVHPPHHTGAHLCVLIGFQGAKQQKKLPYYVC